MPTRFQTVRHVFNGGWATDFGPTAEVAISQTGLVQIPFLTDAENITYEFDGGPHKVGGTSKLNASALESGDDIRGLVDFWRQGTSGAPVNKRVVHVGTTVKKDDADGSFSDIITGLEDDKIPSYSMFDDLLVISSDSTTDTPQVYDHTTVSSIGAGAPNFAFSETHQNRTWAAGDAALPSRLYYGPLATESGPLGDWSADGGFIDIDPGDGDKIVGIASHKNELWVFKGPYRGSIHRITGASVSTFARTTFVEGLPAVGHNSLFRFRDDIGFLCCDGSVHSLAATAAFGDFYESALSRPIHSYVRDRLVHSRLDQAWAATESSRGLMLMAVPADTATESNRILMMDYRFEPVRWSLWTFLDGKKITALASVVDTASNNRPSLWIGCGDGFVRKLDQETRSIDGLTAISAKAKTPFFHYGSQLNKKTLGYGSVGLKPQGSGNTVTFGYERDDETEQTESLSQTGGGVPLDTFVLDTDVLGGGRFVDRYMDLTGEFRSISYRLANSENNADMEVHSFTVQIKSGADSTEA